MAVTVKAPTAWPAKAPVRPGAVDLLPMGRVAERVGGPRHPLLRAPKESDYLLPTSAGWVDGLRIADGVAFTHELSEIELKTGVLAADDDLALWAALAEDGLPLRSGGTVVARTFLDLPPGISNGLPAGQGMIGLVLHGPDGWLKGLRAGDLLRVRLRDGRLEVTAVPEPWRPTLDHLEVVLRTCATAAEHALDYFKDGHDDAPAAMLPHVLAELIATRPDLFVDPLPPLGRALRAFGLETFGGHVGMPGTAWNQTPLDGLSRDEVVAGTRAMGALLTHDEADAAGVYRLLDALLTSPRVVGYVADEVERRTATEAASFVHVLSALAAAVRSPAERAAVTLLAARAAEGAGDSNRAERLVHQALADQPGLVPALMDAGEYAVCRGDLRDGERYLRRVGHPVAETLLATLRLLLSAPTGTVGRNQPCPCGSGRKLKVCCQARASHPLDQRAQLLYGLLAMFAQRSPWADFLGKLINRSGADVTSVLLNLDLVITHGGAAQRFLQARGAWLQPEERALVESWTTPPLGVFEAVRIRPGVGVEIRKLPDGEPVFLRDKLFSTSVRRLDLICGRMLTNGLQPQILAVPAYVSRERRREILDLLAADPTAEQIAEFFGPQPEPYIQNSDGHDYVNAEVTLELPDPAEMWQRLAEAFVAIAENVLEHHVEADARTVSLGRVTREGRRLKLWANSLERLAALEQRVRALAPRAREVARRAQRLGGEPPGRTSRPVQSYVIDAYFLPARPGVTEEQAFEEAMRERSRSWVDEPNGLGVTPREAARTRGAGRAELEAMLDDMQWRNDRDRDPSRLSVMDVDWIRRELGIPAVT